MRWLAFHMALTVFNNQYATPVPAKLNGLQGAVPWFEFAILNGDFGTLAEDECLLESQYGSSFFSQKAVEGCLQLVSIP